MTTITGRNAVVTGGGSGIGRALAMELANHGAMIVVADILLDSAETVAAEIRAAGGRALAVQCDVCERDSIDAMRRRLLGEIGTISLVIANAGATSFEPLAEMTEDDVDWIFEVNLMGTVRCVQTFLPDMIAADTGGHILATASMAGMLPAWIPQHAPYSGAKLGVVGFMLNLGLELGPRGIGTTTYCPGGVATGMKSNNARYRPPKYGGPSQGGVKVPEDFVHENLRMLDPAAVAPLVVDAISTDRPLVFDHSDQRRVWIDTYQRPVLEAFAVIENAERRGSMRSAPVREGT